LFGSDASLQPTSPSDLPAARRAVDLYAVVAQYLQATEHV